MTASSAHLTLLYEDIAQIVKHIGTAIHQLEGKRLLLTGANGFLASYLADTVAWINDFVLSSPCNLIAIIRSPLTSSGRLGHLLNRDDVQFIQQDVRAPLHLDEPIDMIVHAASKASPKDYLTHPLDTMDANVLGSRQLLELARQSQVESFLFLSSGETYGSVPEALNPIPEDYNGGVACTDPRACYAESKRYAETLCMTYWRMYSVPVKIARIFYIYGPGLRLDDGRVIADFLRDRLQKNPIHVMSDGSAIRGFCYVTDAIIGIWKVLLCASSGDVFNIGNAQEPITIRDLAHLIATIEEPTLPVCVGDTSMPAYLRGSPSCVCPEIGKATRLLSFFPQVNLKDGLLRTLAWHRMQQE